MIVTRSTNKNLPIKIRFARRPLQVYESSLASCCGHVAYCKGDDFLNYTLDSYIMAEVSCAAYGLNQIRCYEKAYHIVDQYNPPLVLCQGFRMHYCSSHRAWHLRSPFSQYERVRWWEWSLVVGCPLRGVSKGSKVSFVGAKWSWIVSRRIPTSNMYFHHDDLLPQ